MKIPLMIEIDVTGNDCDECAFLSEFHPVCELFDADVSHGRTPRCREAQTVAYNTVSITPADAAARERHRSRVAYASWKGDGVAWDRVEATLRSHAEKVGGQ